MLEEIKKAVVSGDLIKAEELCMKVLSYDNKNPDAYYNLALISKKLNDYNSAILSVNQAINLAPERYEAYILMGSLYSDLGQYDRAIEYFNKATANGGEKSIQLHSALFKLYYKQKDFPKAIQAYKRIIQESPNQQGIYSSLASLYKQAGDLENAYLVYKQAVLHENHSIKSIHGFMSVLSYLNYYDEMESFFEELTNKFNINDARIFAPCMTYLISMYMLGKIEVCIKLNNQLRLTDIENNEIPDKDHTVIYYHYISSLLDYYEKNINLYKTTRSKNTVYMFGDSHCLASVGLSVKIDNKEYKCEPRVIVGAKAKDFYIQINNRFKPALKNYFNEIKKQSTVILMFGEIDCHPNMGIYKYLKKNNCLNENNIKKTASNLVEGYVNFCEDLAKEKDHKLIFCGLPVSNRKKYDADNIHSEEEQAKIHRFTKDVFNKKLQKYVLSKGFNFIDLYSLTNSTKENAFIDDTHVKPSIFKDACDQYFI